MNTEAHASDIDLDAIAQAEGDPPDTRETKALDGDSGDYAQDRKGHESEQVEEDEDSKQEGQVWKHGALAISLARAGAQARYALCDHACS
jgi:hypothetical protein